MEPAPNQRRIQMTNHGFQRLCSAFLPDHVVNSRRQAVSALGPGSCGRIYAGERPLLIMHDADENPGQQGRYAVSKR